MSQRGRVSEPRDGSEGERGEVEGQRVASAVQEHTSWEVWYRGGRDRWIVEPLGWQRQEARVANGGGGVGVVREGE